MGIEEVIVILAILGMVDSAYTVLQRQFPGLFAYCFNKHGKRVGCYEILHSKHASVFGVPNSLLGVIAYALLAFIYSETSAYLLGAVIATLGMIFSYYLLYVQACVLKKYCVFCLTSTTLITVITVLALAQI